MTPWNTQLPTPYAAPPAIESRRNEQFDPFARSDLGPDTMSRPREYSDPRSRPRQVFDAAAVNSPIMSPGGQPLSPYPQPAPQMPPISPVPTQPMQPYPGTNPF